MNGMKTAVIGGTGIGDFLLADAGERVSFDSRHGSVHGRLRSDGILVVSRHGEGHRVPPHAVNYRAIASGLRDAGYERCISSGAVGSLREELMPGTLAAVVDFIDLTGRNITLFEDEVVHTDFTPGVSRDVTAAIRSSGVKHEAVYACTNGPRYETPAEVRMLRTLGADVVGMTVASEAVVMREAGIEYGCLAIVTNLAPGIGEGPTSHEEVVRSVRASGERAAEVLLAVALS